MDIMEWIVLFFGLGMVNFIIVMLGVKRFLNQHAAIRTRQDLDAFKQMARKQMYQTLIQIVFMAGMELPGIIGILMQKLTLKEFLLFLGLNAVYIVMGIYGKANEKKIQSLEVEDEALLQEYQSICETWKKKPFPDF